MTTAKDVMKQIKDNDVKFVDLRFTDPKGKLQHVTMDIAEVEEEMFADGVMFDGSSVVAGRPSTRRTWSDARPGSRSTSSIRSSRSRLHVSSASVSTRSPAKPYNRDPRGIAKKAEAYLQAEGIADTRSCGPEAEFFVFDDVKYKVDPYNTGFKLNSTELPSNDDTDYETGNLGHRPRVKGLGHFPVPPVDSCQDMRSEMLTVLSEMGVRVEKHHHEVAAAQHELGFKFDSLVQVRGQDADLQVRRARSAHSYGKTATFMPKPIIGDNGSGMHVHLSIWKKGKTVFAGNEYAGLSEMRLSSSAASSSTPRRSTPSPTP